MHPDGSDQVSLTGTPFEQPYGEDPVWSPDGARIAYANFFGGSNTPRGLYVMNADGSSKTHIGNDVTPDREPAWSPDGSEIAFLIAGNYFKTPPDGSNYMQLPGEPGGGYSLDWSPDGQAIAYEHSCTANYNSYIGVMEATSPYARTPVTSPTTCEGEERTFPYSDHDPSWSPDGQRILFTRNAADTPAYALYTIKRDGTDMQLLKSYPHRVKGRWSPDGTKIVVALYNSSPFPEPCRDCLSVMNADGTGETLVAEGADPDWQPIPINGYPRPKGASPMRVSLVPAYAPCTSANKTHGAPLAFPSCSPPQPASAYLTTGTPDANARQARMIAWLRLKVRLPSAIAPSQDVEVFAFLDDVANRDLTDYTGSLRATMPVRITDKLKRLTLAALGPPRRSRSPSASTYPARPIQTRTRDRSAGWPRPSTRWCRVPPRGTIAPFGNSARCGCSTAAQTPTVPPPPTTRCSRCRASSSRSRSLRLFASDVPYSERPTASRACLGSR